MKKTTLRAKAIVIAAAMGMTLFTGCMSAQEKPAAASNQNQQSAAAGTMLLSVNPEIEIDYDDKGKVLEIEGKNDDGKNVVKGYTSYEGKDCEAVVKELVEKIYEGGYFEKTVGGHEKNIVVKLAEGSKYPDDDFLEDVAEGVRGAVKNCHLESSAITVDEDDYAENGYIGLEKAKELVLAQLGLKEATFTDREYSLDDGVYELEFTANGVEYEFEVNAVTGKILEADYEHNDDWKDYDDDKDDDHDDDRDDDKDDKDDIDDKDDKDDKDDDQDDRYDDDDDDDRPAATAKPTSKPSVKPNYNDDDDDDDRYDDDRYENDDDDRYDDDKDDDNDRDDDDKDDDHDDDKDDDHDDDDDDDKDDDRDDDKDDDDD